VVDAGAADKLLTVIVPAFNVEEYLPRCLESLAANADALARLDVIVVNDGSTDGTGAAAHAFARAHPLSARVLDKPNGHYGSCVNAALPLARGRYVKILDADDAAEPSGLAALVAALAEESASRTPADCVLADYAEVDVSGRVTRAVHYGYASGTAFDAASEPRLGRDHLDVHALSYRTDMLRTMGYRQTEGVPYTDTEWYTEPFAEVARVRYVPQVSAHYVLGREGQSMAAANYLRDFHVIPDLALALIRRAPSRRSGVGYALFRARIRFLLEAIYVKALLSLARDRPDWDLAAFDARLLSLDPQMYAEMQEATTSSFRFHYVAAWRRRRTSRTLSFAIYWGARGIRAVFRRR